MTKRISEIEVEGRRDRSRPCTRWLDWVKKPFNVKSRELIDAKAMCMYTG